MGNLSGEPQPGRTGGRWGGTILGSNVISGDHGGSGFLKSTLARSASCTEQCSLYLQNPFYKTHPSEIGSPKEKHRKR